MAVEVQGSAGMYLEALRGDMVQKALGNKQMPVQFLAYCIESGVVNVRDETLLFEIEKSIGRRLKPRFEPDMNLGDALGQSKASPARVSSTKGMPVVGGAGSDKPPFARIASVGEMFSQTVKETDAKIAASPILKTKDFPSSIVHNARRVWCTPELMKCLLIDPSYVDKLRAAAYPALVSYCERTFTENGRTYMAPYITVINYLNTDGTLMFHKGDDKDDYEYDGRTTISTTFYLNNKGGIGAMTSSTLHLYDVSDFFSKDAVSKYLKELERMFDKERKEYVNASDRKRFEKETWGPVKAFLEPYATGKKPINDPASLMREFMKVHRLAFGGDTENIFLNIKTRESCYATIRNNVKEIRKYGPEWFKVVDVTDCVRDDVVKRALVAEKFERQKTGSVAKIKAVADESLCRLSRRMLKTDSLTKRGIIYVDTDGEDEYLERDYSI